MSLFDAIASNALGVTQGIFASDCSVIRDGVTTETRATFGNSPVETDGISSMEITAEFVDDEFTPEADDLIQKGSAFYRVSYVQKNNGISTCILKLASAPPPLEDEEEEE